MSSHALVPAEKLKAPSSLRLIRGGHKWKSIGFTIAVALKRRTLGLETITDPEKVVGRAMGLRGDGQCFFATVDLPWVWRKSGDWRRLARKRLDTFLSRRCHCRAGEGDTITCKFHEKELLRWHLQDEKANHRKEDTVGLDRLPLPGPQPGGLLDSLRVMHRDYAWCRHDVVTNEWFCILCGARRGAYDNNSSYRNQFILLHAKCGFDRAPKSSVPDSIEDKVIDVVAKRLDDAYHKGAGQWADTAHAFVRNQRGTVVIE